MLCLKTINKGFSPPYGDGTTKEQIIYTPEMFSPPYGEKLKYIMARPKGSKNMFPSPCGDKLKWAFFIFDEQRVVLSSPQGDKLK